MCILKEMSHVGCKERLCRPVEFQKQSCRPVEFKKQPCRMSPCRPVDFRGPHPLYSICHTKFTACLLSG